MKKSQAAMEFLMTYGWAILVVLTAISALAYFGVLDPQRFFPSKCIIDSPELFCRDQQVSYERYPLVFSPYENIVRLDIKNNAGVSVQLSRFRIIESQDFSSQAWGNVPGTPIVQNGDTHLIEKNLNKAPPYDPQKQNVYVNFELEVINTETSLTHVYQGRIRSSIT